MRKSFKRCLSILLTLGMLLSMLTAGLISASAETEYPASTDSGVIGINVNGVYTTFFGSMVELTESHVYKVVTKAYLHDADSMTNTERYISYSMLGDAKMDTRRLIADYTGAEVLTDSQYGYSYCNIEETITAVATGETEVRLIYSNNGNVDFYSVSIYDTSAEDALVATLPVASMKKLEEQDGGPFFKEIRAPEKTTEFLISDCESIDNWYCHPDDSIELDTEKFTEGSASINLHQSGGFYGGYYFGDGITMDFTDVKSIRYSFYANDAAALSSAEKVGIALSSDATNTLEYRDGAWTGWFVEPEDARVTTSGVWVDEAALRATSLTAGEWTTITVDINWESAGENFDATKVNGICFYGLAFDGEHVQGIDNVRAVYAEDPALSTISVPDQVYLPESDEYTIPVTFTGAPCSDTWIAIYPVDMPADNYGGNNAGWWYVNGTGTAPDEIIANGQIDLKWGAEYTNGASVTNIAGDSYNRLGEWKIIMFYTDNVDGAIRGDGSGVGEHSGYEIIASDTFTFVEQDTPPTPPEGSVIMHDCDQATIDVNDFCGNTASVENGALVITANSTTAGGFYNVFYARAGANYGSSEYVTSFNYNDYYQFEMLVNPDKDQTITISHGNENNQQEWQFMSSASAAANKWTRIEIPTASITEYLPEGTPEYGLDRVNLLHFGQSAAGTTKFDNAALVTETYKTARAAAETEFLNAVAAIGTVTADSGAAIEAAKAAKEALTQYINYQTSEYLDAEAALNDAISTYTLLDPANADVKAVVDAIEQLPAAEEVDVDDAEAIEAARTAYDNLATDEKKALVHNLDKLVAAEKALEAAQEINDAKTAVEAKIAEITKLGVDNLTAANVDTYRPVVDAAREAYDAFHETYPEIVIDIEVLEAAEKKIEDIDAVVYGDLDGDKTVTTKDALMALQAAVGKIELTDAQKVAANVDGEGEVTTADALLILQRAVEKIADFPVERA